MSSDMSVVFLGTSSGGGPSDSRNCSSLVCDMLADQSLWMVDCAEGTTRQFALQPARLKPNLKIQNVTKVFVTHMHADHVMGLTTFLRNVLLPPPLPSNPHVPASNSGRTIHVYGPSGLRTFIRQNLKLTHTRTSSTYAVHELLTPHDPSTPCIDAPRDHPARMDTRQVDVLHYSEEKGQDLRAGEDGLWRGVTSGHGRRGRECVIWVDAGPIMHRDPCIGYVFTESLLPARKLVILGDTFDPSAILPLCTNASLLIHEATDSHISLEADPGGKLARRTKEQVKERALEKGHSVPEMAGEFAKRIGASALVLNHIGGRFPAPRNPNDSSRIKIIRDIEKNAESTWESGKSCKVAYDFLKIDVPMPAPIHAVDNSNSNANTNTNTHPLPVEAERNLVPQAQDASSYASSSTIPVLGSGNGRKRARSVESDGGIPANRDGDRDWDRGVDLGAQGPGSGSRGRRRKGRGGARGPEHMTPSHSYVGRGRGNMHRARGMERNRSRGMGEGVEREEVDLDSHFELD